MRIAVDARPLTVPMFGIGRYTSEVLSRLMQQMDDMQWYLYSDRPLLDEVWKERSFVRSFSSHQRLLSPFRTQLTFAKWAGQDRIDTYWSPRHHLPLALGADIRQVVTIHDLVWQKYPQTMQYANYWTDRLLMPASVKQATKVLAVSHATARDLVESFPDVADRLEVTQLAATAPEETVAEPELDKYLLFVGTAEPRKNLEGLLRAFASVADQIADHYLVIAGAQGWMEAIETIVGRYEVPRVSILGHVSDVRLDHLYRHATALLMPSFYEGFGLPALEAMQRGIPVIGANVSSLPEVIGDAGILIDPSDTAQIAEAMIKIVDNQSFKEDLSQKAKIQSKSFSWDQTAKKTALALFSS